MLTLLLYALLAIGLAAGLFLLAVRLLPAGEQIAPVIRDEPIWSLPAEHSLSAEEVAAVRIPVALRGYRFAETDLLLDRLSEELRQRDELIARLRGRAAGISADVLLPVDEAPTMELPAQLAAEIARSPERAFVPGRPQRPDPVSPPWWRVAGELALADVETSARAVKSTGFMRGWMTRRRDAAAEDTVDAVQGRHQRGLRTDAAAGAAEEPGWWSRVTGEQPPTESVPEPEEIAATLQPEPTLQPEAEPQPEPEPQPAPEQQPEPEPRPAPEQQQEAEGEPAAPPVPPPPALPPRRPAAAADPEPTAPLSWLPPPDAPHAG